jgi:hypothetical protein
MKVSLMGAFRIKGVLAEHLLGVNVETGERKKPDLRLPMSMKRHLRRVLEAVDDEIKVADPERIEFISKWKVYGEKKDEFPKFGEIADFDKEYKELFFTDDLVIPFTPFHLDLLDNWNEYVPDDVDGLMNEMNQEFENQKKAEAEKSAEVKDKAPESAKSDA